MISIITPTNNVKHIADLYETIREQTYPDWEWVVLLNNGATATDFWKVCKIKDARVKLYSLGVSVDRVGALKYLACKKATGDIVIEVDHDDWLTENALQRVYETFEADPDVSFVYSNFAQVNQNWEPLTWNTCYGWEYRPFVFKGRKVTEIVSPKATPHNVSLIWYAPNHLRAWRAKDYWAIGGHNQDMKIADDHDLVIRFYLHGKMAHIDECLYVYRVHGENTWLQNQADIQVKMWGNYDNYIFRLIEKWSDDAGLMKVDLCGGIDKPDGYMSMDISGGDITADLNQEWPVEDNSVGVIRAYDALEHLKDPVHIMNEAYRALVHGGFFMIMVPSTDGRGAFQDPTHVSFWNENSFWYYTKANYQKYLRGQAKCRFQVRKLETVYPSQFCIDHKIPYVKAHLIAIKSEAPRFHGLLEV